MTVDERMATDRIAAAHELVSGLRAEVSRFVVGQQKLVDRLLIALFTRGHVLVEGVPGLAKTLLVKTMASALDATFKRVQFTPDLLPADITGTLIFDPANGTFNPRFGPIFTNLLLADEINRAPAKVQSALLEAMQERQVTIGDSSYRLPEPFVVIATQNPIEHEGTYSLPEAQVDRFLLKVQVGYPRKEDEAGMLGLYLNPTQAMPQVRRVLSLEEIAGISAIVSSIHVDEKISRYIVELVSATPRPIDYSLPGLVPQIAFGASPRATLAFAWAAKGHAFLSGRAFVIPEDIKEIAADVLRHRLILTYEAAAEQIAPEHVIEQILRAVPVP
jgi:MoxR-like ATPase